MSLDVYLKEDVTRILRGLLFAHPEWEMPLTAVALSFGIEERILLADSCYPIPNPLIYPAHEMPKTVSLRFLSIQDQD